ncbi:hypothetical protein CRG98_018497 [Punica granatum]|uniref:Uncharacterized protein n=1 Tax=Punica granatum TaxID=22663 RepID=A0A2I0JXU4_PUNGR|nr:hypothetical protein CRG98_018497 [Punica granatum]
MDGPRIWMDGDRVLRAGALGSSPHQSSVTGSLFDTCAGVQRYEHRGSPDQPSPGLTG